MSNIYAMKNWLHLCTKNWASFGMTPPECFQASSNRHKEKVNNWTEASQNLFAVAVMKEQMGLMKSEENALREEASKRVSDMESGAQNLRNRLDQEEFARHATCCFLLFMVNWVKFVNDSNSKKKSKLAASKHGNRMGEQITVAVDIMKKAIVIDESTDVMKIDLNLDMPMVEYTFYQKQAAKQALRFLQKDLRHHIGRRDGAVKLAGAYHATEYYNLQSIMTEGIKAGRDLMGNHGSSGRLHRYWGMFPPWDQRNRVTRSKSGVDQWLPVVTLYVPIVDLVRAGGKLTKSGVIMCDRPIPFHLVKEVWLGVPDSDRRKIIDQVEKILDYEREDEICVDWQRPLTPVAKTMESYRSLEGLLHLLCEMPDGPHDTMRVNYVSRLSEYCGVDWNHVDWDRYEERKNES
ncbi:hypothetical protein AK812_SmicGene23343 [Symbiodinium microadriaticum]|uniref:Uncharacterized protein n=1 Tax=Symbiodinium microadriaticum TaxID=2951 RepID=A0A1Q9DHJ3_SYMMI|nr:hypothetical protein AK812_SmicGene23343 [Symbiodinium microadriaticum]CAE7932355.1 unnamed protein product [Symbiodinium sp. KB8]